MQTPTELDLQHYARFYDPVKAHQYYERTKKLKGRKKGTGEDQAQQRSALAKAQPDWRDPRSGKSMDQIRKEARAKARKRLTEQIKRLDQKLLQLEAKIRGMERAEAAEDRKSKAKKERAAKEADKPKTAAEKREAARESEKYRDKNQQKLKSDAKDAKSGGGGSDKKKSQSNAEKISQLKITVTRVKGQLAVAKQKLAAL